MSASNYPPGVTGNEPHITGIVEFDPHQPFWVGDDPEVDDAWAVYEGDGEGTFFGGFDTRQAAVRLEHELNFRFGGKECWYVNGRCQICGDTSEPNQ